MSDLTNPTTTTLTADEQADKLIMKQIMVCIFVMMGIAVAIVTTANSIA